MSEEKDPPLKLKPRVRPDVAPEVAPGTKAEVDAKATAVSVAPGSAPNNLPSEDRGLRIRSKPRLSPDASREVPTQAELRRSPEDLPPSSFPVPTGQDTHLPAADPLNQAFAGMQLPSSLPPPAGPPEHEVSAGQTSPPLDQVTNPVPVPMNFSTAAISIGGIASEPMTVPAPKSPFFKPPATKPIHIQLSEKTATPAAPASARPQDRKAFKLGVTAVAAFAMIGLGFAGFFAFRTFQALRGPRSVRAKEPATAMSRSASGASTGVLQDSTPATSLNSKPHSGSQATQPTAPASQAGRLIQAARKVSSREDAELNDVLAAGSGAGAAPAKSPHESSHAPVSIATPAMSGSAESSAAFVAFADAMRINGVFQGNPARASINGRIVRAGALLDASLGVTFDGIDPRSREIILKDTSGATIRKKY